MTNRIISDVTKDWGQWTHVTYTSEQKHGTSEEICGAWVDKQRPLATCAGYSTDET